MPEKLRSIDDPDLEDLARIPEKKKLYFIDASASLEGEARDMAEAKLTEEKGKAGILKKILFHNWFRETRKQVELNRARKQIVEGLHKKENQTDEEKEREADLGALVDRFAQDLGGDELHELEDKKKNAKRGEKREVLVRDASIVALEKNIQNLVKEYVTGQIDKAPFIEQQNRLITDMAKSREDLSYLKDAQHFASNLFEFAEGLRSGYDHTKGLESVDTEFEIVVGRARDTIRTEAHQGVFDRMRGKLSGVAVAGRFGQNVLFNEVTLATGLSVALAAAQDAASFSTRAFANSKAAAWMSLGGTALLGGAMAASKEGMRVDDEMRFHAREMAQGKEFSSSNKRRAELEKYRLNTKSAEDLLHDLKHSLYTVTEEEGREVRVQKDLNPDEFRDAVQKLAEIEARIKFGDNHRVDLISFKNKHSQNKELLELDKARAGAKVYLDRMLARLSTDEYLGGNSSLKELLDKQTVSLQQNFAGQDKTKTDQFVSYQRGRALKAAGMAMGVGTIFGLGIQEGMALIPSHHTHGLLSSDKSLGDGKSMTLLRSLRHWATGSKKVFGEVVDRSSVQNTLVDSHTTITHPTSLDFKQTSAGTFGIFHKGREVIHSFTKDSLGNFDSRTQELLHKLGFRTEAHITPLQNSGTEAGVEGGSPEHLTHSMKAQEYIQSHGQGFRQVHRLGFVDNGTPKPEGDEIRLHWGGHGTGIEHGKIVYDVESMTHGGTIHGKFNDSAMELARQGKLKMLFSFSVGTQHKVFEVPVSPNGKVEIDPTTEPGKYLFSIAKGKAHFLGRFAEVAEVVKTENSADTVRILATHEGKGLTEVITGASAPSAPSADTLVYQTKVTVIPEPHLEQIENPIEYALSLPVMGRTPLERSRKQQKEDNENDDNPETGDMAAGDNKVSGVSGVFVGNGENGLDTAPGITPDLTADTVPLEEDPNADQTTRYGITTPALRKRAAAIRKQKKENFMANPALSYSPETEDASEENEEGDKSVQSLGSLTNPSNRRRAAAIRKQKKENFIANPALSYNSESGVQATEGATDNSSTNSQELKTSFPNRRRASNILKQKRENFLNNPALNYKDSRNLQIKDRNEDVEDAVEDFSTLTSSTPEDRVDPEVSTETPVLTVEMFDKPLRSTFEKKFTPIVDSLITWNPESGKILLDALRDINFEALPEKLLEKRNGKWVVNGRAREAFESEFVRALNLAQVKNGKPFDGENFQELVTWFKSAKLGFDRNKDGVFTKVNITRPLQQALIDEFTGVQQRSIFQAGEGLDPRAESLKENNEESEVLNEVRQRFQNELSSIKEPYEDLEALAQVLELNARRIKALVFRLPEESQEDAKMVFEQELQRSLQEGFDKTMNRIQEIRGASWKPGQAITQLKESLKKLGINVYFRKSGVGIRSAKDFFRNLDE